MSALNASFSSLAPLLFLNSLRNNHEYNCSDYIYTHISIYIHTHFIHFFKMLCFRVTGWILFNTQSSSNHWYRGEIGQKKLLWQIKVSQFLVMSCKLSTFNYSIFCASLFLLTYSHFLTQLIPYLILQTYFKRTTFIVYILYSTALHWPLLKYQPINQIFTGPFNSIKSKDFLRT